MMGDSSKHLSILFIKNNASRHCLGSVMLISADCVSLTMRNSCFPTGNSFVRNADLFSKLLLSKPVLFSELSDEITD